MSSARKALIISEMKIVSMNFLVKDPSVSGTSIEKSSYLLWRIVAYINVCNVREVQMIVQMKAKASTALLSVMVELTLIHMVMLFIKLLC